MRPRVCSVKPLPVNNVDTKGHAEQKAIKNPRRLGKGLRTKIASVLSLFAMYVNVVHDPR